MHALDLWVVRYLNHFVGTFPHLDAAVWFVSGNQLLKGGVLCAVFWALWAEQDETVRERRIGLIALIWACFFAVVANRILADVVLPFRPRPIFEAALVLTRPHGMETFWFDGESSLPSDHAAMFTAFAVGLFFVSRRAGVFALLYTATVILLPRLYLGLHYPTDILAGALLGGTCAWACRRTVLARYLAAPLYSASGARPGLSTAAIFVVTWQIAAMFGPAIQFVSAVGGFVLQHGFSGLFARIH